MESKIINHVHRNSNRGFTLIELLVVISIIALLMAIMIPSLSKARRLAQSVVGASNLGQIGLAFSLYFADNNDRMPLLHARFNEKYAEEFGVASKYSWWTDEDILRPYVTGGKEMDKKTSGEISSDYDDTTFFCPVTKTAVKRYVKSVQDKTNTTLLLRTTYTGNAYVQSYYDSRNDKWHHSRISMFKQLSNTPLLYCCWWPEGKQDSGLYFAPSNPLSVPGPSFYDGLVRSLHISFMTGVPNAHIDGGGNFLFLDGHAERQSTLRTWEEYEKKFNWQGHYPNQKPDWAGR